MKHLLALLVLLGTTPVLRAQDILLQIENQSFTSTFFGVAGIGDVNGDGTPDLLVGLVLFPAQMRVVSGLDGSTLYEVSGETTSFGASAFAGLGDFDGDGVPDFAIGETGFPQGNDTQRGRVLVFSGATAQVLAEIQGPVPNANYGRHVASVGDVDGDGFADVAFTGSSGYVYIHRGPNGAHLRSHQGPGSRHSVAGIGDVDGDGHADYIAGWPQDSTGGLWAGKAIVYSGKTGAVIHQVFGSIPHNEPHSTGDHLGRAVSGVGDIDGDGVPDFACGAPGELEKGWVDLNRRVLVYSGADASLLFELDGNRDSEYNSWYGGVLDGGMDVNGDGVPDILVGAPHEKGPFGFGSGSLSVYSGRTGTRIWRIYTQNGAATGRFVALVGDLDGDGLADFASGDKKWNNNAGRVLVWAGFQADAEVVCAGAQNSVGEGAFLEVGGDIAIASSWHTPPELIASNAPPGVPAVFFYGHPTAAQPFGDGTRCLGAPAFRLAPAQLVDVDGTLRRELSFTQPPAGPGPGEILPGSTRTFQLWYRDAPAGLTGFNLSEALRITFAP